jgi:antitoxin component YwqK of YwqJK toxin-antitoxin module
MMDMQSLNNMGITLKWYRYNSNSKSIDSLAGRHWEEIPAAGADKFKCNFTPNTDLSKERIKVIGSKISITKESISVLNDDAEYLIAYKNLFSSLDQYKDENENINWAAFDKDLKKLQETYLAEKNGDIESIIKYESDEIVFNNTVEVFDISTFNATSALSIQYKDGSDGNYYIYNTNGKLPSANKGRGYEREMQAIYNG